MPNLLLLCVTVVVVTGGQLQAQDTITAPWQDMKLDGDAIGRLEVQFKGPKIDNGASLTIQETAVEPQVKLRDKIDCDRENRYTLLIADPDAPSKQDPFMAEWVHWLVVNDRCPDLGNGVKVIEYNGPDPSPGSGPHRYAIIIIRQNTVFTDGQVNDLKKTDRGNFKVADFVKKNNMEVVAGKYFTVKA